MQKSLSRQIDEFINNPEVLISTVAGHCFNANAVRRPYDGVRPERQGMAPPGVTVPQLLPGAGVRWVSVLWLIKWGALLSSGSCGDPVCR